ncbi:hypothetical protein, partial [Calditerricola satsumensis]|uniref:hypothetical protein n=1 Tax=Calditerricola satsumensis TaxID=373054 RepID=UPI001C4454E5
KLWYGEEWLLIRPSGTEPLVRLYAEAATDDGVARYLAMGRDLLARCGRMPHDNGRRRGWQWKTWPF